jgi:hypothetical protein
VTPQPSVRSAPIYKNVGQHWIRHTPINFTESFFCTLKIADMKRVQTFGVMSGTWKIIVILLLLTSLYVSNHFKERKNIGSAKNLNKMSTVSKEDKHI